MDVVGQLYDFLESIFIELHLGDSGTDLAAQVTFPETQNYIWAALTTLQVLLAHFVN